MRKLANNFQKNIKMKILKEFLSVMSIILKTEADKDELHESLVPVYIGNNFSVLMQYKVPS